MDTVEQLEPISVGNEQSNDLQFSVNRESLIKPLSLIASVIDKKQALPILSHVLLKLEPNQLTLVGTDLEIELLQTIPLIANTHTVQLAVPGKKLYDICRSLPSEAEINFHKQNNRLIVRSGRSRFVLSLIVARDFPEVEKNTPLRFSFTMQCTVLRYLIEKTSFSMAQQDVRFFLNGLLLDMASNQCTAVATDGHRLSVSTKALEAASADMGQILLPRKAALELTKLLDVDTEELLQIQVAENYISVTTEQFAFTSKLIEGQFPEYRALIPKPASDEYIAVLPKELLRGALSRVATLSNEKCRGAWLSFDTNTLKLMANNPDKDEAEDELLITYNGPAMRIGCNINYLLDVLNVVEADDIYFQLPAQPGDGLVLYSEQCSQDQYIVMPMSL